jgi:hypothetical protein
MTERMGDAADHADLAKIRVTAVSGITPALGCLARADGSSCTRGSSAWMSFTTSAEGSTSSMRQPLVAPTSMYSMKRSTMPLPLEMPCHRQDLVVVGAAFDHHVDLDRAQPCRLLRLR